MSDTTQPGADNALDLADKLEALANGVPEHIRLQGWFLGPPSFGQQYVYAGDAEGNGKQHIASLPRDKGYFGTLAEFIAAANPAAVLALIALARRAAQPAGDEKYTVYGPAGNRRVDLEAVLRDALAGSAAQPVAPAVPAVGGEPDECAAAQNGHRFGPHGRKGERQCEWCGIPEPVGGALVAKADFDREEFMRQVLESVCEISDRDSPEGQPEMCLVTTGELKDIMISAFERIDEDAELAAPAGALVAIPEPNDELRDQIGQAIADYAAEHMNPGGQVGIDWCSANDIDPLADKIVALIPTAAPTGSAAAPAEQTQAARDVLAERRRQVEQEGWTPEHDDEHADGQMAGAAACYAVADITHWARGEVIKTMWPWALEWWKPTDHRRNLVKASALIIADIERLDRATNSPIPTKGNGDTDKGEGDEN